MAGLFGMQPGVHAFAQRLGIQRLREIQRLHHDPQVVVPPLGADDLLLVAGLRGRGAVDARKPERRSGAERLGFCINWAGRKRPRKTIGGNQLRYGTDI